MDLVILGIQGSGKGTQSRILSHRYDMSVFETGAQLRRLAQEETDLGKKVKSIIEAGHLVPNEIVMDLVQNYIKNQNEGRLIIFDGIPRKKIQAETFDGLMNKDERDYKVVILEISEEEALRRLTRRRVCQNCKTVYPMMYDKETCECGGELKTRKDDNPESIKTRIEAYFEETMPVVKMYEEKGIIIKINGEQSINEVSQELFEKLDSIYW